MLQVRQAKLKSQAMKRNKAMPYVLTSCVCRSYVLSCVCVTLQFGQAKLKSQATKRKRTALFSHIVCVSFLRFVLCVCTAGRTGQAGAVDTDTRTKGLPFFLTLCACHSYVLSCVCLTLQVKQAKLEPWTPTRALKGCPFFSHCVRVILTFCPVCV